MKCTLSAKYIEKDRKMAKSLFDSVITRFGIIQVGINIAIIIIQSMHLVILQPIKYFYITSFSAIYMLFAISTGYFKVIAMLSGMLNLKSSKGWTVTPKFGTTGFFRKLKKPYFIESVLMIYYGVLAAYEFYNRQYIIGGYVAIMSCVFLVTSFGDILL